jgi:hypothetical protein
VPHTVLFQIAGTGPKGPVEEVLRTIRGIGVASWTRPGGWLDASEGQRVDFSRRWLLWLARVCCSLRA